MKTMTRKRDYSSDVMNGLKVVSGGDKSGLAGDGLKI